MGPPNRPQHTNGPRQAAMRIRRSSMATLTGGNTFYGESQPKPTRSSRMRVLHDNTPHTTAAALNHAGTSSSGAGVLMYCAISAPPVAR